MSVAALENARKRAEAEAARDNNLAALAAASRAAWAVNTTAPVTPPEARKALMAAHAARTKAEAVLAGAQSASAKARAFAASAKAEVDKYSETERVIASERAARLREAMKKGDAQPSPAGGLPAGHAQAKADALVRLDAAEQALASLAAEDAAASRALESAKARLSESAKAVVTAEADSIAAEVERLEALAAALRERLGPLIRWRGLRTERLTRVMRASDWFTNSLPDRRSQACGYRWQVFSEELLRNPNAEVSFENLVV